MGVFSVSVKIKPLDMASEAEEKVEMTVDTGAYLSVVPRKILEQLGIQIRWRRRFRLADGRVIERDVGAAVFAFDGEEGVSDVVFGEETDHPLLGAVTIESMALQVNMQEQKLEPMGAMLML